MDMREKNLLLDFDIVSVHFGLEEWKLSAREFPACLGKRPNLNLLVAAD